MRIVYLHGFASGPQSSKAQFFSRKFSEAGIDFEAPRLDRGNFEGLTITGQLAVVEGAVGQAGSPVVLMGSSLGGYISGLYAARHPEQIEKLVLLAPAFQFPSRWRERFSAQDLEQWKRAGSWPFFHYGSKKEERLGYAFIEDGAQYEDEPDFYQPCLILHGTQDPVVPFEASRGFAQRHPNASLREFHSGHELTDVLDDLWASASAFLSLEPARGR